MQDSMLLEKTLKRDRAIVAASLASIVAIAWIYTLSVASNLQDTAMNASMAMPEMQAWRGVDFLLMFAMWAVMMIAMMVPSVTPMILLFAAVNRRRREQHGPFVPTLVFLLGYLLVWSGFSVAATLAQWGLHTSAQLTSTMGSSTSPMLTSVVLLAAGIFQWTPLKHSCLTRCRTPFKFVIAEWRDGKRGALVMGLRHGVLCAGCCWLLMALLFVSGIMNLLWVAGIAALVLVEKLAPDGRWASRGVGLALMGWGAWTLVAT